MQGLVFGRPVRAVLPLGNGGVEGAESDPKKLALTEHLLAAVLAEAKMCCSGQPVMLVGDLNADPLSIPAPAKSMSNGAWIDVEKPFATGRGVAPALTCQFQLDEGKGTRRDFALVCPVAMAAITACGVLPDRWFSSSPSHILQSARISPSLGGTPLLRWLGFARLFSQPAGYNVSFQTVFV